MTDDHVRQILEDAQEKGLLWETVRKIRAVMSRDFERARKEKLIAVSPVADAELPDGLKKDKRPFLSHTDAEIAKYLAAPKGDLELKLAVLTSRTQGGMRTAEVLRWDGRYRHGDLPHVQHPARKDWRGSAWARDPQVLRPFLRGWWERAGKPVAGPVFPVRRGPRTGQRKEGRGYSFAKRVRRDMFRAGVVRLPPVVDKKTKRAAPNPSDPLYFDTPIPRRPTFHRFRRAYDRALAHAGVNMQTA